MCGSLSRFILGHTMFFGDLLAVHGVQFDQRTLAADLAADAQSCSCTAKGIDNPVSGLRAEKYASLDQTFVELGRMPISALFRVASHPGEIEMVVGDQ